MQCPHCYSKRVFRSERGNATLFFPLPLLIVCVRCHHCGSRFYRRGVLVGGEKVPPRPSRRPQVIPLSRRRMERASRW